MTKETIDRLMRELSEILSEKHGAAVKLRAVSKEGAKTNV